MGHILLNIFFRFRKRNLKPIVVVHIPLSPLAFHQWCCNGGGQLAKIIELICCKSLNLRPKFPTWPITQHWNHFKSRFKIDPTLNLEATLLIKNLKTIDPRVDNLQIWTWCQNLWVLIFENILQTQNSTNHQFLKNLKTLYPNPIIPLK